jgi:hypothetical protein
LDNQVTLMLIGVVIGWAVWRLAQSQRQRGAVPGRPVEATITWLGSYSAAFQRALNICELLEIDILDADPNRGTILARAGISQRVGIALRTQEGVTTIVLTAGSGVVEVGQSERLARRFVEIWDRMPDPV